MGEEIGSENHDKNCHLKQNLNLVKFKSGKIDHSLTLLKREREEERACGETSPCLIKNGPLLL